MAVITKIDRLEWGTARALKVEVGIGENNPKKFDSSRVPAAGNCHALP